MLGLSSKHTRRDVSRFEAARTSITSQITATMAQLSELSLSTKELASADSAKTTSALASLGTYWNDRVAKTKGAQDEVLSLHMGGVGDTVNDKRRQQVGERV